MSLTVEQLYREALARPPVLHSGRLLLRTPLDADIPAIVAIAGDWEVASRLARMPHPYSEENARFFLDEIVPAELTWAIVERETEEMVGMIGLTAPEPDGGMVELGYYIARQHWRRGIATEAAALVAAYGAGLVGQERLKSGYFTDNPASGRVLEKIGFASVGESMRPCLAAAAPKPSVEVRFPV